ncbi:TlpA family protein disulfide reductase [Candidatus Sulfurimonas baltica]|uniref:TlpA family protein disulfide reductase n=1 Tax=Candidatus Sulfurimonas baltica TaxID=2740404 RepID=A0A7S7RM99_9BACT|nr:TlpA disulfide reductase family protein [Candidatus Sulfurimonas baltica]QOY51105.1 TlpA family protein disulfide reductase [Candidatus Sulfurimonas baltica]
MLKKSILFISILSTLIFQGCSNDENKDVTKSANDMISVNEYVLTGLDSKQYVVKKKDNGFVLEGAKGKVVIFDIFATWCPPCKAAATHLSSLQEKYKDDLIIIGITIEDKISNEKLLDFAKEYTANYTLVNSDQNRRLTNAIAFELELGDRYPIPTMAMYKDGVLINHFIGATEEEFIESDIKRALGK